MQEAIVAVHLDGTHGPARRVRAGDRRLRLTGRFARRARRVLPGVVAGDHGARAPPRWWLRRVVLPPRPDDAPTARPAPGAATPSQRPSPDGAGVMIAVNPSSGPAWTGDPTDELRRRPAGGADRPPRRATTTSRRSSRTGEPVAVGAAGGDGTLSTAAAVALERDAVLVAVPAGHVQPPRPRPRSGRSGDAVEAVRDGTATRIDLGVVESGTTRRTFVNTLSFGGYTQIVDARERLEPRLGKWLALVVALVTQLPRHAVAAPRGRRRTDRRLAGLDRQLQVRARTGSDRRGGSGSTTVDSTSGWCSAGGLVPGPASWSTCSSAGCATARSTGSCPSSRSRCDRSTDRCAWPSTARPSTVAPTCGSAKLPRALLVAVP